jgi:hypothetical protein
MELTQGLNVAVVFLSIGIAICLVMAVHRLLYGRQ